MRTIVRDTIASVKGPGVSIRQCRILFDSDGNAAVFVPSQTEPIMEFIYDPAKTSNRTLGGTGTTIDGIPIAWSKRGANCSFKLAKCHMKTGPLAERWPVSV